MIDGSSNDDIYDDVADDAYEEEEEEIEEEFLEGEDAPPKKIKHRFDRENRCEMVWTGMATKRQFKGFVFQHCETSAQTRKVLSSKGVGQYWDQVLAHASGSGDSVHLKLVDSDSDDEMNNPYNDTANDDNDNDDMDVETTTAAT